MPNIYIKDISAALSTESSIPKLSSLILVQTGTHGSLKITQTFVDQISSRNLKDLDVSQTVILFRAHNLYSICDTIAVLNLSYTQYDTQSEWPALQKCESMRVLDISGMIYPKTFVGPKLINRSNEAFNFDDFPVFLVLPHSVFRSLRMFYINKMVGSDHHLWFRNCSFSVSFNNSLEELHISHSGLNRLEMAVTIKHNHLRYVDLSFNDMEGISSKFFSNMAHLTKVDLSFNKLYGTTDYDTTFSQMFTQNTRLAEIDMSRNNLKYIPAETFSTNVALERLDLSGNSLQQITFGIKQLHNLSSLNMTGNAITYLDTYSRKRLDAFYHTKCPQSCDWYQNKTFIVDLQYNPFSCACQSLEFIRWFISSPIFDDTRALYSCEFDGQNLPMDHKALATAEYDCESPRRKLRHILLSALVPLASIVVIAAFISILWRQYKKIHIKRHYDENVALIRENPADQFPVFLSYSSNDRDLVVNQVLRPLEVCIISPQQHNFNSKNNYCL